MYGFQRVSPVLRTLSYVHYGVVCPLALLSVGMALGHPARRYLRSVARRDPPVTIG